MRYALLFKELTGDAKIALLLWIIGTLLAFWLSAADEHARKTTLSLILNDPATAIGRWTSKDCNNHASRQYTFDVKDKAYHGSVVLNDSNCGNTQIGSELKIVYDMNNPQNNVGGDIKSVSDAIASNEVSYIFPLIWSSVVFMFLVRPHLRRKEAVNAADSSRP